jgi:hypothetical protein
VCKHAGKCSNTAKEQQRTYKIAKKRVAGDNGTLAAFCNGARVAQKHGVKRCFAKRQQQQKRAGHRHKCGKLRKEQKSALHTADPLHRERDAASCKDGDDEKNTCEVADKKAEK